MCSIRIYAGIFILSNVHLYLVSSFLNSPLYLYSHCLCYRPCDGQRMRAVTLVCNCLHTLYVLIIAAFHFVIVSKPTNRITQESPCKGAFVESYLQDAPVTGGGMMAIHRDRSVADLKGRRAYFNHCFTASSSPPSRLSYPLLSLYYPPIILVLS